MRYTSFNNNKIISQCCIVLCGYDGVCLFPWCVFVVLCCVLWNVGGLLFPGIRHWMEESESFFRLVTIPSCVTI